MLCPVHLMRFACNDPAGHFELALALVAAEPSPDLMSHYFHQEFLRETGYLTREPGQCVLQHLLDYPGQITYELQHLDNTGATVVFEYYSVKFRGRRKAIWTFATKDATSTLLYVRSIGIPKEI